ncbi:MAG: hypothetical protein AAF747_12100 [Planctomycetota bacterium]
MSTIRSLTFVLLGLLLLAIAVRGARLATLHQNNNAQRAGFAQTAALVGEIHELREADERVSLAARPQADVLSRVQAAMQQAGLAVSTLRELAQSSDVGATGTASDSNYRTQSYRFVIQPVRPSELGRFVAAWDRQSLWHITEVELSHLRDHGNAFSAQLVISAAYVDQPQASAQDMP